MNHMTVNSRCSKAGFTRVGDLPSARRADVVRPASPMPGPNRPSVRIYPRGHSVTQSGRAHARQWVLEFEPTSAPFIEPLMGWTGSADTRQQVRLFFPSQESALRFAARNGWRADVSTPKIARTRPMPYAGTFRGMPDVLAERAA